MTHFSPSEGKEYRYYQNSGGVPLTGIVLMLLLGPAVALVLSPIYGALSYVNPFIFVNWIGTIFLGFAVGWMVQKSAVWGKVRNQLFNTLVAVLCIGVTLYASWVGFMYAHLDGTLVLEPGKLWAQILAANQNGVWSLTAWTPTGWVLWIFWGLEALFIALVLWGISLASELAFCEHCNCWAQPVVMKPPLRMPAAEGGLDSLEPFVRQLESENYDVIYDSIQDVTDPDNFLELEVTRCPRCDQSIFLSLKSTKTTIDSDGDKSEDTDTLVSNLYIPPELLQELQQFNNPRDDRSRHRLAKN